ncbi:hypothetical protein CcrC1_gp194 [Caulobacter phage C1]|nr:hypothetical protein CcrC1_gp194 [Caulobacter phage C1]UTU08423.1 hypothetical protein CcrC2_gp195 [Caulobacter phage C2]UTU08940.1 hypothetical protein CcrJ4_gp189 [Caulobacter phage J4]UTU09496.1 hypothetical protein CcrBL47_gp210 [Caulobacter phage BL47]UTU10056.1 hypothetical protein CcrRB23_gp194 [Caulobacter phage RB23]WGN97091.1 hypothetical protein [Bertelyvirus sp.]
MVAITDDHLRREFKKLLTQGFYVVDEDGVIQEGEALDAALLSTKPWRGDLWKAFRLLEDRLWPAQATCTCSSSPSC